MSNNKRLKAILEEIKMESEEIIVKAGEIQKTGNFAKELADVSISQFDQSPLADEPMLYITDFRAIRDDLLKINLHMDSMGSLASGVAYGTAAAMTTLSGTTTPNNFRLNPSYVRFYNQFDIVIDRGQTKDQVVVAIKRLGIQFTKEGREAIRLLESAWDVHLQGHAVSISSLIPLREAIAKTLVAIQKRSPQSKIKNWIIDLGAKVALADISATDLKKLQVEHKIIRNKLSGSKQGNHTREEERILLREGTLHLLKVLNMVDPAKLNR